MIRSARRRYEVTLLGKVKIEPKTLFRYIRSQTKVKAMVGPLDNGAGQLTKTDEISVNMILYMSVIYIFII